MMRGKWLACLLLVLAAVAASALDTLAVHSGLLLIVNAVEDGAPDALVPPLGAWTRLPWGSMSGLSWEAGLMVVGLTYRYEDGRGVPMEIEAADTFWVLGLAADLRVVKMWPIADKLALGATMGVALLLRVPVIPYDDAAEDWGSLAGFFAARSLFPEAGVRLRWQALERTAVALELRALYPLSNLWDGEAPSVLDHFTVGALAGLEFRL